MKHPRLNFSLRVENPSPLVGAPPAAWQSRFRGVCRHGLLRGLRNSGPPATSGSCVRRAGAVEL